MQLCDLLGDEVNLQDENPEALSMPISALVVDSRKVKQGCLFAALKGTHSDGRQFIDAAITAGAAAVLTDQAVENCPVPVVLSVDPRLALAKMAARFYARQPHYMAAVTGTAGKTSVASFLRQIWRGCGENAAMIGTTGVFAEGRRDYGSLTTPDPVFLHSILDELAVDGITHCAMEASSHGLDQRRLDGVRLAVGGFTNLGRDHLDYHPTVEAYLAAKMRLFDTLLTAGKPAVIFADDPYSDAVIEKASQQGLDVKTVGHKGTFLALKRVEQHRYSQVAEIDYQGHIHRITLPMAGEFQLANALVAAGMALACGGEVNQVFASLESLKGAPGRLELVGKTTKGAPAYVDYAHKPEALENVLLALKPYTSGQLVLVFGCGGDRDKGKRAIMGEIAQRLADVVIICDDNPRNEEPASIRQAILQAAPRAVEIGDRRQAIEYAVGLLGEGDSLVVAGKGHEEGQIVGKEILPFSDHAVLAEALKAQSKESQ